SLLPAETTTAIFLIAGTAGPHANANNSIAAAQRSDFPQEDSYIPHHLSSRLCAVSVAEISAASIRYEQNVSVAKQELQVPAEPKSPADASHASALAVGHVFAFPVATKSVDAQKLIETALDQYENVLLENSVESARKATEKDPQFALAYAVWSFAARRNQPNPEAARKAETLAARAPADERVHVNFLTSA